MCDTCITDFMAERTKLDAAQSRKLNRQRYRLLHNSLHSSTREKKRVPLGTHFFMIFSVIFAISSGSSGASFSSQWVRIENNPPAS